MIRLDADALQRTEIARRTGIGVASVYRVLADAKRTADNLKAAGVIGASFRCMDATCLRPSGRHGDDDVAIDSTITLHHPGGPH